MPQHPKYSNSPSRDLRRLYQLVDDLECYGLVHEEIHQNIDHVMSRLHPEATRALIRQETGAQDDGAIEDNAFIPGARALFHYVSADDRPQFIQDLRNLIAYWMFSDDWRADTVVDLLRAERDIAAYHQHVMVVEDTDTLDRYDRSRRTVWFPSEVKPARPGAYEISPTGYDPRHGGFAYWDGRRWYGSKVMLADCLAQPRTDAYAARWDYCWRGFLEPQD